MKLNSRNLIARSKRVLAIALAIVVVGAVVVLAFGFGASREADGAMQAVGNLSPFLNYDKLDPEPMLDSVRELVGNDFLVSYKRSASSEQGIIVISSVPYREFDPQPVLDMLTESYAEYGVSEFTSIRLDPVYHGSTVLKTGGAVAAAAVLSLLIMWLLFSSNGNALTAALAVTITAILNTALVLALSALTRVPANGMLLASTAVALLFSIYEGYLFENAFLRAGASAKRQTADAALYSSADGALAHGRSLVVALVLAFAALILAAIALSGFSLALNLLGLFFALVVPAAATPVLAPCLTYSLSGKK